MYDMLHLTSVAEGSLFFPTACIINKYVKGKIASIDSAGSLTFPPVNTNACYRPPSQLPAGRTGVEAADGLLAGGEQVVS